MTARFKKFGAIAGISFPIVQMIAQSLIQVGGTEPKFTAATSEILAFFQNRNSQLFEIGGYLTSLSAVLFIWFVAFLWNELRSLEGESGMLSMIALGSGLVTAAAFNVGGWALAIFRLNEGLSPEVARLLFDEGNFNFANMWVSTGSMVLAAGLIFRASSAYPRWLGSGSVLVALALFAARAVWILQIAFLPYVLFWVWMIYLGVVFLRRPTAKS